jgi:hypothetical protein
MLHFVSLLISPPAVCLRAQSAPPGAPVPIACSFAIRLWTHAISLQLTIMQTISTCMLMFAKLR